MTPIATSMSGWTPEAIRRLLQISLCAQLCFSGVFFAAADGLPLGLLSVPITILGLMLTDWREQFAVSGRWANVLGLIAFAAAAVEYFGESLEAQLLSFGHLLLYLTWILSLQPKHTNRVWWLCVLSLLQIAVASILTNEYWFPIAAMGYTMLAMWTLSVFSLHRAIARSAAVESSALTPNEGDPLTETSVSVDHGAARPVGPATSESRNNLRLEATSRWMMPRFVVGILACGALSLLLGVSIFVLTPRIWIGRLRLFEDSRVRNVQPLTGFTEEVMLGDIGEILENPNLVLEVAFFDNETNAPVGVKPLTEKLGYDAPFFRGEVLEKYRQGRWSPSNQQARRERGLYTSTVGLIRQEIRLHPIGTETLFTAGQAVRCKTEQDADISIDELRDTFSATPGWRRRRAQPSVLVYEAYSGVPGKILNPVRGRKYRAVHATYEAETRVFPAGLERLEKLARTLSQTESGEPLAPPEVAQRMLSHLRDSGEYRYTLNIAIDDPAIDPVEDFLFNRRQGQCEYFASALALMLRAEEIPTRLVSGFKGGALNEGTGLYEVRQLHAHAWVEAYLDGQWTLLDPTPADRDVSVAGMSTTVDPFERLIEALEDMWARGLFMNQTQQQAEIYRPMEMYFRSNVESIRQVGLLQSVVDWFRELGNNPQRWISGWGFVTAFLLGVLLSASVWSMRGLWRFFRQISLKHRREIRQQQRLIAFYERFRRLVAKQGYVRPETRTDQEFAGTIERQWRQGGDVNGLDSLPSRLTEAFYRVRFGEESLSEVEAQDIDASLDLLEQRIASAVGPSHEG